MSEPEENTPPRPQVDPDGPRPTEPVVWWAWLDDKKYQIEVHRTGQYRGRLLMWDISTPERPVVLDEEVALSYQALFGPDVDDVALWQSMCLEVADARAEKDGA